MAWYFRSPVSYNYSQTQQSEFVALHSDRDSEDLGDEVVAPAGNIQQDYVWTRKKVLTAPQAVSTPKASKAGKTKGMFPAREVAITTMPPFFNHNVLLSAGNKTQNNDNQNKFEESFTTQG